MTARYFHTTRIECDSCGALRDGGDLDAKGARITARGDGWKYATWDINGLRPASVAVPAQWDCCPDCPLPGSASAAAEIWGERNIPRLRVQRAREEPA